MIKNFTYQLGIFSWFGFVLPLPERVKLIKETGFDATTLWWEDEIGVPNIKKENMPNMVRDSGLILENIHIPYDNCDDLWSEYKPFRDAIVNKYIGWLNDCAKYNIPMMVMHITDSLNLPSPNQHGMDSISRLLTVAEDLGVIIAIENTGREDYICFVLSEINSDYLGFCYDSSHNHIYSGDNITLLEKLANRLITTHLSDNDGHKDRHWLPGEGIINWEKVSNVFSKTKYNGFLTLEVYPTEQQLNEKPEDFLSKAYQSALWIRRLWER
ncbi:MAG: sugar phosphate isomerase/epimerase [Syntrophomonadaceae bacterium]|nr:sugar phosphate isomerase/epimerase [Syntrophomonadaceae bacterium]MDD4549541.1 sugar phosphate isomerase/epimerase [Syntrophomonadaceae bacterium]